MYDAYLRSREERRQFGIFRVPRRRRRASMRKKGYGVCTSGALGCYPSRLCSTCKLKVRSRCCLQLTRFCRATLKTILRKGPLPETPIASAKDANGMRSMTHVYCDCDLCTEMIQRCAKIFELRIVSTNKPIASSGAVMIRLV